MQLYKFRFLSCGQDYSKIKDIIEKEHFRCSRFSDFNDPMEGVFTYMLNSSNMGSISEMYGLKSEYKICSFAGKSAFQNLCMWGYYANGFMGVAIEIEASDKLVKQVKYVDSILDFTSIHSVEQLLTTKLKIWRHESEYRFLERTSDDFCSIGKITAIHFGDPFGNVDDDNKVEIYRDSKVLGSYSRRKRKLINLSKKKGINCYEARTEHCGNDVVLRSFPIR